MEYGTKIDGSICNNELMKYVGFSTQTNPSIDGYFNQTTVNTISKKITELLTGVGEDNRPIVVPDKTICSVMSDIYSSFRPPTGDIFSRYVVPSGMGNESYIQSMIDQVIEVITMDVKTNLGIEENNRKLTVWSTLLGDFNEQSLRSHPPIKIREKRPNAMQFNMNY